MELGEKIRKARQEAGLSQRQLCGEEITRNMLSLIENGAARPSVKTLRYLSQRLGKPLSYFLEEQAEETTALLSSYVQLGKAEAALAQEKYIYAAQLLEQVTAPAFAREKLLLLGRIPGTSPAQICAQLPSLDGELLLRAGAALEGKELSRCEALLAAVEGREDPRFWLLRGMLCYEQRNYAQALEALTRVEEAYPRQTLPLLEECCKALDDYRGAYAYACKQRG